MSPKFQLIIFSIVSWSISWIWVGNLLIAKDIWIENHFSLNNTTLVIWIIIYPYIRLKPYLIQWDHAQKKLTDGIVVRIIELKIAWTRSSNFNHSFFFMGIRGTFIVINLAHFEGHGSLIIFGFSFHINYQFEESVSISKEVKSYGFRTLNSTTEKSHNKVKFHTHSYLFVVDPIPVLINPIKRLSFK